MAEDAGQVRFKQAGPPPAIRGPVLPLRWVDALGRSVLGRTYAARALIAFVLISLSAAFHKPGATSRVLRPLVRSQIHRAGVRLWSMTTLLAFALGFLIIGQTLALLTRVGIQSYAGEVMVGLVVRELGPLAVALLVLARVGTTYVIELGAAEARGEVRALEASGLDPIHYLVVPRMVGLVLSVFSLTVYFILSVLVSGYIFAFLQDVPLLPAEYFRQLGEALTAQDFVVLGLKPLGFGAVIATFACFHGLARPMRLENVSGATTRAVVQSVAGCAVLDAVFLAVHLAT